MDEVSGLLEQCSEFTELKLTHDPVEHPKARNRAAVDGVWQGVIET
jgi:hypothetical protein